MTKSWPNTRRVRREDIVTKRTRACPCPNCGLELSGATGWTGHGPKPGNMCVCIRCGHLLIFNEDMTVREPNDDEVVELAGNKTMLTGQHVAAHMRHVNADWRTFPVPDRMKHLPLDPRGYPIPFTVLRDAAGKAHFTINETPLTLRVLNEDLCAICGKPLLRGRWFVGGPASAFDPRGAYVDPPAHQECARYALKVCPYLATPNYGKLIDGRTLRPEQRRAEHIGLFADDRVINDRPPVFVAVHARGHRHHMLGQQITVVPAKPYIAVEYWQHGWKLAQAEGEAICREMGFKP